MNTRERVVTVVRSILACLVYVAALAVPPLLITALSQWIPVPTLDWFHPNSSADAPPLGEQLREWLINNYRTARLALDDRARGMLLVIAVLGASWLVLIGTTLSTLWCWTHDGLTALRGRAGSWGPRGWLASLLTTLVLSGTANPAHASTQAQPVATAPHHPHDTQSSGDSTCAAEQPVTPGDHSQPPPREAGVHLPNDIRPDCPRYRVQRGDTLTSIAQRELGSAAQWHDLARINAFQLAPHPDQLEPGWLLLLPPEAKPPDQGPTTVVTVARGDTLWSLSERELGTPNRWGELWDLNLHRIQPDGLRLSLPDWLQPGWQIVVPDEPHNRPAPGYTPVAPVPSQDPFTTDPWPAPFPSAEPIVPREPAPGAAPAPTRPARPPARATRPLPQHGNTPHKDEHQTAHQLVDGIEPAAGVFLGLGLAAAMSLALRVARLRHQAKYTPGRPFTDYQPAPTVRALHQAHLATTRDPETDEPHATDHTDPHAADQSAVRPTPRSRPSPHAPAHAPLPIELGAQEKHTVRLDLASCQGLGLSGPANTDAVRALLLQLLSRHTPREQPPLPVVMTRPDAHLLLNDVDDPPSTVQLVDDLPAALELLERASTAEPPAEHPSTQDTKEDTASHTVLVARTPLEHAYQLYTLLRDRRGIAAVLLGPWPDGVNLTLDHHGLITHATPDSSQHLCGTRLFTATAHASGELEPLTPTPRTPRPPTPPPVNLFQLTYGYDPRDTHTTSDESTDQPETDRTNFDNPQPSAAPHEPPAPSDSPDNEARTHPLDSKVLDPRHTDRTTTATDSEQDRDRATNDPDQPIQTRDPNMPPLRLQVFGPFRLVWTDREGREHDLACTRGQRLLLTYLALHPHGVDRETALDQLWGGVSQPTNTANTHLSRLRKHLHRATNGDIATIVDTTHHRFRLDLALVRSDYADFDQAATQLRQTTSTNDRHQALQTLLRCHVGPLGAGLDDQDWLTIPRYEAERLHINAIGELARTTVDHDPDHTLHLLESALRHDPYNEALYRDIMRLQHQLNLDHTISRTYTLLTTRLEELDLTPDQHTTALVEHLLQQPSSHRNTSPHHETSASF